MPSRWLVGDPKDLSISDVERLNIGRRFWGAKLDDLEPGTPLERVARNYIKELGEVRRRGHGLMFYGANGTGKTWAAAALLKECMRRGFSCYCVMADVLKVAYIDGSRFDPHQTIVQRVESVDFLLVEDLGKEYSGKGSGWAELCFENMLRKRSRAMGATWVTTNLTPQEFSVRYEKSVMSLAHECMTPVNVRGSDMRPSVGKKMTQILNSDG